MVFLMQLKEPGSEIQNTIKKILSLSNYKKNKVLKRIFLLSSIFVIVFVITLVITLNFDTFLYYLKSKKTYESSNALLKLAEEAYYSGYLDNSAVHYQNYVNRDIPKLKKILAYKRLFAISVLNNDYAKALTYLDTFEQLDKKNPEVYINRLQIYLRMKNYEKAKLLVKKYKRKFGKYTQFKELISSYYIVTGDYAGAFNVLKKIKFRKRSFNTHKKIILCSFKMKKYDYALKYIRRIENKVIVTDDPLQKSEIIVLKSFALIMIKNFNSVVEELERAIVLSKRHVDIIYKLLVLCCVYVDDYDKLLEVLNSSQNAVDYDIELLKSISDYFIFRSDYSNALKYFEYIRGIREFTRDEFFNIIDLYYKNKDYKRTISFIKLLFEQYDYKSALLFKNLGYLYTVVDRPDQALFFFKEGNRFYPDEIDFYLYLAKFYYDQGRMNEALEYVEKGKSIFSESIGAYDKRLDSIYLLIKIKSGKIHENDLLALREKDYENIQYYFNLINYYLHNHKYYEAMREIETVKTLALGEYHKRFISIYNIVIALYQQDYDLFNLLKNDFIAISNPSDKELVNLALIFMIDNDYDGAINLINNILSVSSDVKADNRLLFYKAVNYYYKNKPGMALRLLNRILESDPLFNRASYLKNLIITNAIPEES